MAQTQRRCAPKGPTAAPRWGPTATHLISGDSERSLLPGHPSGLEARPALLVPRASVSAEEVQGAQGPVPGWGSGHSRSPAAV